LLRNVFPASNHPQSITAALAATAAICFGRYSARGLFSKSSPSESASSSLPPPTGCMYTEVSAMSCNNGDCKRIQRVYRQCANRPKELLVNAADGADRWMPVEPGDGDPDSIFDFHKIFEDAPELLEPTEDTEDQWLDRIRERAKRYRPSRAHEEVEPRSYDEYKPSSRQL